MSFNWLSKSYTLVNRLCSKNPQVRTYRSYINGNWHKFWLFRFLNRVLFCEEKETFWLKLFSSIQLIPYVKSAYHYIAVLSDKRHLCLQRGT